MKYELFDDVAIPVSKIPFKKLRPDAVAPRKAYPFDAGWDLTSVEEAIISVGEVVKIRTGIAVAIPNGYSGRIAERSGLGSKGIALRGGEIDASYRGELIVQMHNLGRGIVHIMPGMRIAQLVIGPILLDELEETDELSDSDRGSNGFGSSGV